METTISEIEVDSKDEKRPADVSPQEEKRKGRTSTLCFKRRKKAAKTPKPKAGPAAAEASRKRLPEAGASDQPQRPGGVWASFKGLVTRKKRSDPSKKQKSLEAEVHPEIKTEGVNRSKKKAKSRLKIPCMRFSRGKQQDHHSKVTEDSDYHSKEQVEAKGLEAEAQTPLDKPAPQTKSLEPAPQTKSPEDLQEEASQKQGEEICESPVSNSITSGEHVISVELESENEHSAILAETPVGEKEIDVMEETQSVQPQPVSPLENSESESQRPGTPDTAPAPAIPEPRSVEEASNDIQESGPDEKDDENREQAAEENRPEEMDLSQAEETEVSQGPDLIENGIDAEKPKSEESKRMEPIAIIITDTEISEFDVKKSKNVPKQFLISMENEQVGVFANDSDFEGRTSEQYETLLIETASSLVKNAIQLSIEQLVNEMVSEDNQINTLLQ